MTQPENPPKLWAFLAGLNSDESSEYYVVAEDKPVTYPLPDDATTPQAYVREDVAAEQTAAALRGEAHETTALRRERDALRLALRKVQTACQYTGTNPTLLCAADVKAIVEAALALTAAGKGVG